MSIAQLYENGERQQDRGHFRNMVLIAKADGVLDPKEKELLHKIGSNIGLTDEQIMDIMRNPENYPYTPPFEKEERYEQVINLIEMAHIDGSIADSEMKVLERVILEIGFRSVDDVDIESILAMVIRGEDMDIIIDELLS